MKNRTFCLVFVAFLIAAPAVAEERKDNYWEEELETEEETEPVPNGYTFQDYLSDLKACARADAIDSGKPPCSQEPNRDKKYKPLNPLVIPW
ncbi:MAG: hypothetical protein A3F90_18485 [Deltaproteobacteria bacterium RIFCSPLOWO2_12_FULL_60_19]|nr:MAG: hypothetical protein A3F90_18485 [Deltaproteobacteria bacterium RIFCSPLOWO2_12_FULL_60_19]